MESGSKNQMLWCQVIRLSNMAVMYEEDADSHNASGLYGPGRSNNLICSILYEIMNTRGHEMGSWFQNIFPDDVIVRATYLMECVEGKIMIKMTFPYTINLPIVIMKKTNIKQGEATSNSVKSTNI